jgi:toxin FitB
VARVLAKSPASLTEFHSRPLALCAVLPDARLRDELNDWLTHKVRPMFEQRVLPINEDVMFKWRLLIEDGRKAGHTFSQPHLIIAVTGLHHGLTVVTRDTDAFIKARAAVFNPWIDSLPAEAPKETK